MSVNGDLRFAGKHITDQKRLVRAEHWLLARTILRARDGVHHKRWRIMTLSGGAPSGEVTAIRELMPKAHITAVDKNQKCLDQAIDAGVDDVVLCDLADFTVSQRPAYHDPQKVGYSRYEPAAPIAALERFDIINLDLCGVVTEHTQRLFRIYRKRAVSSGGVIMITFSYGRDVTELFGEHFRKAPERFVNELSSAGISDALAARILFLFSREKAHQGTGGLRSVIAYKGSEMPMCSLLVLAYPQSDIPIRYMKIEPGDFELAVCYPDVSAMYDCPHDRVMALRRKFAALKAAFTRKATAPLFEEVTRA